MQVFYALKLLYTRRGTHLVKVNVIIFLLVIVLVVVVVVVVAAAAAILLSLPLLERSPLRAFTQPGC